MTSSVRKIGHSITIDEELWQEIKDLAMRMERSSSWFLETAARKMYRELTSASLFQANREIGGQEIGGQGLGREDLIQSI